MATQGADADAAAEEEPVKCPVGGGGFQELYAVAVLLSHQDKLAEAEVCLSDAITTTVPAYRMLSDIATVNSAQICVPLSSSIFLRATETHNTARSQGTSSCNSCVRGVLRWTGQFGRAAAIAEVIETLTNTGPYQHQLLARDLKKTALRRVLRVYQATPSCTTHASCSASTRTRALCPIRPVPTKMASEVSLHLCQRRKAKERLDVLIEHNGENAEIRRTCNPTRGVAARERSQLSQTLACDARQI